MTKKGQIIISIFIIILLANGALGFPGMGGNTSTIPSTGDEITYVDTYRGMEIVTWKNNYFIGGCHGAISTSLSNIQKWIDISCFLPYVDDLKNFNANYYNTDTKSIETYRSIFKLIRFDFYYDEHKKNLALVTWFAEENNRDFIFSFEKETLIYLIDNKDLFNSALVAYGQKKSITQTPTSTVTHTMTPIIYVTPASTYSVTPKATTVVTPITTDTSQDVQNGKVAILQVVYNLGRKDNGAEVTVTLKNVGSSTAKFVNLSMDVPAGLGAILDSGAEMHGNTIDGNTIMWKGDIEPGKEHIIKYQVGAPKSDIEIPVKVTYINSENTLNKVMAKASAEGISVSDASIDPQYLQTILLIIQIAKSLTPGFETVLAITGIGAIYIIRKVKIRP